MKIGTKIKDLDIADRFKMLQWFCTEVDYAENFSEEERVDLFNEFQIPTSQKYFCPLYSLFLFARIRTGLFCAGSQYSHSGEVLSSLGKMEYDKTKLDYKTTYVKKQNCCELEIVESKYPKIIASITNKDIYFEYRISERNAIYINSKNLSFLQMAKFLLFFGLLDESDFKNAKMY